MKSFTKTRWRRIQVNQTLETDNSPRQSWVTESTSLSAGSPLGKQQTEAAGEPVSVSLASFKLSPAVGRDSATTPRNKNTFLQSPSLHDSSSLSCFQSSYKVSGEVGSKEIKCQISSSMCIKEQQQQQQHADVSCLRGSSLIIFIARGSKLCPLLHLLLCYGYCLSSSKVKEQHCKKRSDVFWWKVTTRSDPLGCVSHS